MSTKYLVKKFGGTSLGTGDRINAVASIIKKGSEECPVVAVVSAISPLVKAEGTTSLLLEAANAALAGGDFEKPLLTLRATHTAALRGSIQSLELQQESEEFLLSELESLRQLLSALSVIKELSPRSRDIVISLGERLSAKLLHTKLLDMGIDTGWGDLSHFVKEIPQQVDHLFFESLQTALGRFVQNAQKRVLILTGFLGLIPGGLLNVVGRGYSDFTTALVAAGLGSDLVKEMQIWKEVDGVFSADPRHVPTARLLRQVSTAEAAEITYFGSEVIHPMTMQRVSDAGIAIRVKNTFFPEREGTIITAERDLEEGPLAVTTKKGVTVCMIQSNRMYEASGFLAAVFGVLRDHKIVVDLISTSEVSVSFTVDKEEGLEVAVDELRGYGEVTVLRDRAIIAAVGRGMKGSARSAATMLTALAEAHIPVDIITEAASGINVSCVVEGASIKEALLAVHNSFFC